MVTGASDSTPSWRDAYIWESASRFSVPVDGAEASTADVAAAHRASMDRQMANARAEILDEPLPFPPPSSRWDDDPDYWGEE